MRVAGKSSFKDSTKYSFGNKKEQKNKRVSLSSHIKKTAMDCKQCVSLKASATWRCGPSLAPARWRRMCCSTASIGKAVWEDKITSVCYLGN
ncbi:hypothetical protein GDO78_010014 [Eleutherodactylus coqui]|uniref:Uncharacterized protein n=1 Tax=Eleutherodactylus coqui TaxID=57060 RepID=A0A8J6FCA0_ELECQ|nr:hypothetical protein GDO78_010014 [Eleutherodactylus coqui]